MTDEQQLVKMSVIREKAMNGPSIYKNNGENRGLWLAGRPSSESDAEDVRVDEHVVLCCNYGTRFGRLPIQQI